MTHTEELTTHVELTREGAVATIRFSSESGISTLSSQVLGELGSHLGHLADDAHVRCVVLRGTGKTFMAGADIRQLVHFDESSGAALSRNGHHVFDKIESLPQVTIAALNGHAMGGGCELALACDFRLMAAGAKIGQPESKLGLIPGWGGTKRLPKLIGLARARRMMFSGEAISAEAAAKIGLIDEVLPTPEDLDAAVLRWVQMLSAGSPAAIARIKRVLLHNERAVPHNDEIKEFSLCFCCSDAQEGMRAFLEKRPAAWM